VYKKCGRSVSFKVRLRGAGGEDLRLVEGAQSSVALNAVVLDKEPHPVVERGASAGRLFAQ